MSDFTGIKKLPFDLQCFQKLDFPRKLGLGEKLFSRRLSRWGIVPVQTGAGIPWKLDLRNSTHRWILYGSYDPSFLKWAKKFLPANGVVVDSGANIGQTVMYLGQAVKGGKLFAFEPGKKQADWLTECVQRNLTALPGVEVVRCALGDHETDLYLNDTWVSERFHGGSSQISDTTGERVQVLRLGDFLEKRGIESIDLWKLDVEGYELQALRGAEALLKAGRIRALYVELFRQEGEAYYQNGVEIRRYLQQFGYRPWVFKKYCAVPQLERDTSLAADGLFLR